MTSDPLRLERDRAQQTAMLDDLIRDSLRVLLPATVALMWIWAGTTMVLDERWVYRATALFALVSGACFVCDSAQRKRLQMAVGIYLSGLAAAVTIIAMARPGATALYFYVPVVLGAAVLTDTRVTWTAAGICITLVLIVGSGRHLTLVNDLISPLLLILLTALAAWLSSHRLYTALDWALHMTRESLKNAQEARERRAEVRSMLKSLEEAYVRLERANQALIFAREAAERAYCFKAEFVANVSHELRTPLNLIVGFSEMMATAPESYGGRRLPSEYRGDVAAIYHAARHLSDLIDDVLDLSQIEAGRLPLIREAADLGQIIRDAADMIRGLAVAKGLRVVVDVPDALPPLPLDRTRIRQVLLNLLSNATRFTDQGWIRVRAYTETRQVRVEVEDSGRGIAPDKITQAFEAFSQLGDDRARQGTGLGLAVSRKFIELHGGEMWIKSAMGQGTTVGFTLPTRGKGVSLAPVRRPGPAASRGERPLVLVMHDDTHVLNLLRRYIEGFEFAMVDTVEKAVDLVQQVPPLAVVVDSTRIGCWTQVAASANLETIVPAIICPLPSARQVGLLLGAQGYLSKPVRREDLLAALARLPAQPRTVLVVDDDPSFARLVIRMLKAHDPSIRVLMAPGGAEGLAVARAQRPDLILLDLLMPEVSGYDVLERLRGDTSLGDMAIIILSARSPERETSALPGELRLARHGGLTVTEIVRAIQGLLVAVTQPRAVAPATGAAPAPVPRE